MEVLYPRCCGLDVHQRFVVACLSVVEGGQRHKETRTFRCLTGDLLALRRWLVEAGCSQVAMESTGVYWRCVYDRLAGWCEVLVVNAQHIKKVPGRKTDVQDAEWLADLLQHGLLTPSFVPGPAQQDLRDLTRLRISLVQDHAQLVNRLHKVLEAAGIKLASVLSDILGVSGRAILQALCAGETNPERLAERAHASVRATPAQLVEALTSDLRPHHRLLLVELLTLLAALEQSIRRVEAEIEQRLRPLEELLVRLEQITGVSRHIAHVLCAEIGTDLSRFPSAGHLAAWAGMCPGHEESAGKRHSGRTRPGNRYVRAALMQAAHATARTKTYLGEQYRRLKHRRGSKRAAVAVGHSILVIFYHMVKTGAPYQEKGVTFFQERERPRLPERLVQRLERLGYHVTLTPTPAA